MNLSNLVSYASDKTRKPAGRTFRLKFSRSVMIPGPDGYNISTAPGTSYDLHEADVSGAIADGDAEVLGEVVNGSLVQPKSRPDPCADIIPAREPDASFSDLPESFRQVYREAEKLRVLTERKDAFYEAAWHSNSKESGSFRRSFEKLERAKSELAKFDYVRLGKLAFEMSSATIQAIETANKIRDEIEAQAREAFALRLSPLGLAKMHLDRLFFGSALAVKFVREALPMSEARLTFFNGRQQVFLDMSLDGLAWHLRRARKFKAELEKLAPLVKAELAATSKALKAA